eukprot:Seg2613.2 transcript_id=Seg2613.2/GoldUCD/mRNA.D3Y31 product="Transposon Ty3-G Gag-Pol polyprotein" protein_id=Seg2613.2/GoldUCD/D3Y31
MGRKSRNTCVSLVGAGGAGFCISGKYFDLPVIIIENFKFDLLLGDEFLRKENFVLDYGKRILKTGGAEVEFEPLPSECVAILKSVTELPVGTPLRVQAELLGNHCGLALYGDRQLVKTDERVLAAPVVTKADDSNSVWLELVNTTRSDVSLQPGTKVMYLQPFNDLVDNSVQTIVEDEQKQATAPMEDFNLNHLSGEEKTMLFDVLSRHHVWPTPDKLGKTHLVDLPIDVQGAQPIRQRPYRVPETKRQIIAKEVQKMLLSNVIQPSASPWSSPVVLLEKPNGEYRFCVDYRRINAVTKKDAYPLPRIDETLDALGNARVFSTLDLQSGFWQIPVRESDKEKTAFSTQNGHFQFNSMPFGLANSPATFQRLMDLVLSGLHWTHCLVYLDDVIVFAPSVEEHFKRLDLVLDRIEKAGLTLKPSKCQWLKSSVKFLGHIVSKDGVMVDQAKVNAVKDFPTPQNKTDVRSFLGLTSYYRRFIENFANRSKPLVDLTKKKRLFQWTTEAEEAFQDLKQSLITAPVLRCPDFSLPFKLYTDACDYGIGSVLAQETEDGEIVIAYASRMLKSSELKYAVLQKEALGIVWSLKHFYPYLYGRHFTIVTDHRPLKWLKTMNAPNNLFARWISEIQAYDFDVIHRPGKLHGNADALSRYPVKDEVLEISANDFSKLQRDDEFVGKWITFLTEGKLPEDRNIAEKMKREEEKYRVGDDECLYRQFTPKHGRERRQLVVPKSQIGQILIRMHDHQLSGHPGFYRTYRKVQQKYFWPTMKSDIKRHVKHCAECAKFKSPKPAGKTPLKSITTSRPLQIVAMDFVGPLPISESGNTYALVIVDHFTRWPVVYSVENIEAETLAVKVQDFIHTYGCPEELLSDRGSHFTAELIKALCKQMGVKKIYTCAFRPSSNGLNEHLNGTLFQGVKMYASQKPSTWDKYLDALVFAYRTTPHSVTQHAPAYLMFGREITSPLDMKPPVRLYTEDPVKCMQNERQIAYEIVKDLVSKEQKRQKAHHDKNLKKIHLNVGDKVWLRDFIVKKGTSKKFHQPWKGPFEVLKIIGDNNVEIRVGEKKGKTTKRVNLEQIKRADEIDRDPNEIVQVHDKMRTRNPGQRLVTKYFVEFRDGLTQWVDTEFVPDELLEVFNSK